MVVPWTAFLSIFYLIINSDKSNLSNDIIDIYSTNVTVEWQNVSLIHTCGNQKMINVPLFKCNLSVGYLEIRDISCLSKKVLDFNESICPVTTTQVTIPVTTTQVTRPVTTIQTTWPVTTNQVTESKSSQLQCSDPNYIGLDCNTPNNPCKMADLCLNGGICHYNYTLPLQYHCQCLIGFGGYNCGDDKRICKNNTCWHDGECKEKHEIILFDDKIPFQCHCVPGYDGINCQLVSDKCGNIKCENNGICSSSNVSWSCRCLDASLYSGEYCQHKTITAIIAVFLFVIIMDILKYIFKIDPVDRERRLMELKERKKRSNHKRRKQTPLKLFHIT